MCRLSCTGWGQPVQGHVRNAQAYENEQRRARDIALDEMEDEAEQPGANAIIDIDFDYKSMGGRKGMLMVTVSGTAVLIR
jgi:uncharacterized protein YbjQ (UPF0145 family)